MNWLQRLAGARPATMEPEHHPTIDVTAQPDLEAHCRDLEERLRNSEARLRERSELLYELQKHYSSEHFELHESMRNLKIERLRNAGMFGDRDIIVQRAKELQARIRLLKQRLREHEEVEDEFFDEAPIVIEAERSEGTAL